MVGVPTVGNLSQTPRFVLLQLVLEDERFADLNSLLIDERDRELLGHIKRVYESGGPKRIGVVYGAQHMRNAVDFLLGNLNYHVAKAEWVTVFDL